MKKGVAAIDLTGQIFGDFKAVEYMGDTKWKCKCVNCGYETIKRNTTLHHWKNYCPECKSLIGNIYGDFKVLERVDTGKKYDYVYKCECVHCGYIEEKIHGVLKHSDSKCKMCNKTYKVPQIKTLRDDLTGQTFGDLTVIKYHDSYNGHSRWECRCKCGNISYRETGFLHNKNKRHACTECVKKEVILEKKQKIRPKIIKTGDLDLFNELKAKGEEFRQVIGFDKYYIGNKGDLFSFQMGYPHLMCPIADSRGKYLMITLSDKGKTHKKLIHRLVAEAFIPNPNNLPEINHINFDEKDNRVENLEWCDDSYNTKWSYQTMPPDRNRRRCRLIFPDGKEMEFDSYADIIRYKRKYNLDFSESGLNYNGKSRGFSLVKLEKASNMNRRGLSLDETMSYINNQE